MTSATNVRAAMVCAAGVLWALLGVGCGTPSAPADMTTLDPSQDHWKIATLYSREAVELRQRAEEFRQRVAVYEQLFGADSEWVAGARLLAEYYENAARDRERLANVHLGLAGRRPQNSSGTLGSP